MAFYPYGVLSLCFPNPQTLMCGPDRSRFRLRCCSNSLACAGDSCDYFCIGYFCLWQKYIESSWSSRLPPSSAARRFSTSMLLPSDLLPSAIGGIAASMAVRPGARGRRGRVQCTVVDAAAVARVGAMLLAGVWPMLCGVLDESTHGPCNTHIHNANR